MRIEIRSDKVILDGYVNAVGRDSRPVITPHGKVVEQIEPGVFQRAIDKAPNVELRLNHNPERKLGSVNDGNLQLFEDSIGLRAIGETTDPEVIEKARTGKLKGWSFGMYAEKDRLEERADNIPRRHIEEMDIEEVSIIDERMLPVYMGTSIEHRAEGNKCIENRAITFRAVTETFEKPVDYTSYEERIKKLGGQVNE